MSNILIVDDEQSYRQLLSLVFNGEGHTMRTATNGREALHHDLRRAPGEEIALAVTVCRDPTP